MCEKHPSWSRKLHNFVMFLACTIFGAITGFILMSGTIAFGKLLWKLSGYLVP